MGTPTTFGAWSGFVRNRTVQGFLVLALVATFLVAVMAATGSAGENSPLRARAELSGSAEMPSVDTQASGLARFRMRDDGFQFQLILNNISGVTQAHIHRGAPDENGPVVAFLFGFADPATGPVDGVLAEGTLTSADVIGEFDSLEAMAQAAAAGELYVNVHTEAYPAGEVRGQLQTRGNAAVVPSTTTTGAPTTTTSAAPTTTTTAPTTTTTEPPTTTTTTEPPPTTTTTAPPTTTTTTSTTTTTTSSPPQTTQISIGDFFFSPAPVTVSAGDTIQWTNDGAVAHTTTSGTSPTPNGTWDSGTMASGASFSRQFNTTGTFDYFCTIHPTLMSGTVTVES